MSSKRKFSWAKRQSSSEPYYRTGGLLPIEAKADEPSHDLEAKTTQKGGRQRPSHLRVVPPDDKQYAFSPVSAQYNAALVNAASNLQAAFNDMLRSPALGGAACVRTPSIQKPLPSRPRSISAPSTPELPAELPGSLLLYNQGFPCSSGPLRTSSSQPISQAIRRENHLPDKQFEEAQEFLDLSRLFPEALTHAKSVPNLSVRHTTMRSVRSGNALNASYAVDSGPLKVANIQSLDKTSSRRRSRQELISPPVVATSKVANGSIPMMDESNDDSKMNYIDKTELSQPLPLNLGKKRSSRDIEKHRSVRNELGASTAPAPTTTRNKQIEELKATIAVQNQTISGLRARYSNLKAAQKAQVASLGETHSAEVASFTSQPSVHLSKKASSNDLLFLLDTTEPPQTPIGDIAHYTASTPNARSIDSSQNFLENQQRSPQRLRNSPDMENLKRKLSSTRRPETASRNLLPELNQYRQNNVALQKQIESLMAKLNESKKNERETRNTLEEVEARCAQWRSKAEVADELKKSVQALQNTIDHLESRLEIANVERLDAQEQLFNLKVEKSPFDAALPKLQIRTPTETAREEEINIDKHVSISTVFSSSSPISQEAESEELSTLAAFIAHIERLQDRVRQKEAYIVELEREQAQLKLQYNQLEQEHNDTTLQSDIQIELLRKTQQRDVHIEHLRAAILDREAIIGEKENAFQAIKRQLELHKLLLQAEIRRHVTLKLNVTTENDPLPELASLAKKEDIDRWIEKLKYRCQKEQSTKGISISSAGHGIQVESLQQEIDFYVREIIYYKLDIRGYKSDIRKLKRITTQLSSYGSRASDLESDTSSLRPVATPCQSRSASATPELDASSTKSPIPTGPFSMTPILDRPATPIASSVTLGSAFTPPNSIKTIEKQGYQQLGLNLIVTPQTPKRRGIVNLSDETNISIPAVSIRSVKKVLSERQMPILPSHTGKNIEIMSTKFSSNLSATPQRVKTQRSMSESILQPYAIRTISEEPVSMHAGDTMIGEKTAQVVRGRSASASDAIMGRGTHERPQRPQFGILDFFKVRAAVNQPHTLHVDLPSKAMRQHTSESTAPLSVDSGPQVHVVPAVLHPHSASTVPVTSNVPSQVSPPLERKLSAASTSYIPFVITMGSPHNPALLASSSTMAPTSCSITRNAPLKINSSVSRTGVGGTMSSSTPVTSPISPVDTSRLEQNSRLPSTKPVPAPSATSLSRNNSTKSEKQADRFARPPRTPSHSRNGSGSSIRTAIRLPKSRDKEKEETHKMKKDSIGLPIPLGSPFEVQRSMSVSADGRRNGEGRPDGAFACGIGEAI